MPRTRTEEQFPLLLVLVGDQDGTQNNKRIFRGRFDGISSGATNIITEWPNYLSSCWVTSLVFCVTLFLISVMFTSCMTFQQQPRLPRCVIDTQLIGNRTVHLVHTTRPWRPDQIQIVKKIAEGFPSFQVHVLVVGDNTTKTNTTRFWDKHDNVLVSHLPYESIFKNTPLEHAVLSEEMKVFAVRVLEMWQFGGITYDLLEFRKCKNCTRAPLVKVLRLVRRGFGGYEGLDEEEVSVDRDGLHMECKTPCHAFFGKLLMRIKKMGKDTTPRGALLGPMYNFCKAGAVVKDFCHTLAIKFY